MIKKVFNTIFSYVKSRKYILLFSLVYFLIRLIFIDSYFLLRDERDLILTSLSLAQTGKDLYGHLHPIVFSRISPQTPLLGMYWTVPIISLFHISSPIFTKVLHLLPTLFFPFLVFELILSVTKEKRTSYIASFVISFSPWYFHISRLVMDANLAYFFCLLGLIFYSTKKRIVGIAFLLASYFSYFGIRPFLLISVPYIELWVYASNKKKNLKKAIVFALIFAVFFGCLYIFGSKFEGMTSRSNNEIIILNKEKLTLDTNFLRSISSAPFFIRKFIDNKSTVITQSIAGTFFKGIDFSYLFFSSDYLAMYSNHITGQFFPFLFIPFIMGICYLAKKKRADYYFVSGLSVVGLVSSLINSYSLTFSIRSSLSLVGIGFICALGLVYAYELIHGKKWKAFYIFIIGVLYISFSFVFVYKYFFQIYNTVNSIFNEEERYVAKYSEAHNIKTIMTPNNHTYFLSFLATIPALSPDLFKKVQSELNRNDGYTINGHTYVQCDIEQIKWQSLGSLPTSMLIDESCISSSTKLLINQGRMKTITKLLDPEYEYGNTNRAIKYYYFK